MKKRSLFHQIEQAPLIIILIELQFDCFFQIPLMY